MFYRKSIQHQRLWKSFISFDLIDCDPPFTGTITCDCPVIFPARVSHRTHNARSDHRLMEIELGQLEQTNAGS